MYTAATENIYLVTHSYSLLKCMQFRLRSTGRYRDKYLYAFCVMPLKIIWNIMGTKAAP